MKASKFFKLKAEWDAQKILALPVVETIPQAVEEVKSEESVSQIKPTKKKPTNEKQ